MTKDGPFVKNGEGPVPEASPGPSSRRGGNGAGGGCPPPPPPPRPSPSAPFHEDHRRELEALRTELEAERLRSQEARRRFALEARELREAAEKERQLLVDQLRSKWEQQRARELHQLKEVGLREREAEIRQLLRWKEAELRQAQELLQRERDAAMRQARDLQRQLAEELVGRCKGQGQGLSGEGRAKLQEVLGKLRWEVDGEQAARIRHLKAELELERSLFLKYILQRFEGEQPTLGFSPRGPKSGPHSLSSLMAACRASRSHSLEGGLNHSCESPKKQGRSCCAWSKSHSSREQQQQAPENALGKPTTVEDKSHFPEEQQTLKNILGKEVPMEVPMVMPMEEPMEVPMEMPMEKPMEKPMEQEIPKHILEKETSMETNNRSSQEQQKTPHITLGEEMSMENGVNKGEGEDVPLEEKEASEETGGQEQPQDQQAQEVLSGSGYDQLVKQNAEFLKALVVLEQRCTHLKNENTLLRKSSFPEMQDKVKRLKKKNVELASIAKRLEEGAKRLQESSLKFGSSSIPVAMSRSDMELYKTSFARQRAKDLSEQTSVILAKDQQLEALRRECWELHSKRSAGKESQYMLSICDFERLLRESQKEVLRLQRQIMLKNLRDSLEHSKMNSDSISSSVSTQETSLDTLLEKTSLPKETQNILVNNVESESLPAGNGIENKGNSLLKTDPDTEYRLQVLTEELSSKSKECEILGREMEEKQKRCDDLETQLKEVLDENARITEENSHLEKKSEMAQKMENENTEINAKLMQATDARNSAVQLTKGLESKVENLEQIIRNLKEIVERRQQLVSEHEQTLLVLQTKDEEIQQLQQIQAKTKKENEETVEQLKARVKELENQRHSQTECFHRLSRAHGQLQKKKSEILELESSRASYTSESITYPPKGNEDNFHISGKSENCDKSPPVALLQNAKVFETYSSASKSDSIQNSSRSRSNPKEDTTDEIQEPETDKISMNLELENRDPTKLRVFLARYSYDPFDGPNKNPETELPLTAGEYVYICGEMDEDGFYEGELMDGRRGMIPSNLVEEVSGNDLISFHPLEASYHCYHEIGCPYRNASSEEGNDNTEEDLCINLLSNEFRGEMCDDQAVVPYPRNLTLIRKFDTSVIIGWDPPQAPNNRGEVHSYNIYVNADLCCNVKHRRQMKAMIENLALKFHSYRISVQSVTDKGLSDKLQCTFLVGHGFRIAPTLLELRSVTATSAEITWLPSSSNYTHTVYLNEKEYDVTETGVYWYTFRNLKPNSQYHVKVEARAHFEELEQKSREMTFTTLLVGLPNPPLDVQVHPGSSAEFLNINWLPVTIDAAGSSNGVKVTGYAVYINGWKVTEVMSPTAGSVSLETTQLPMFHGPCMVFVKTLSPYGESVGSVPALIPAALLDSTHSSLPIPVAEHDDGHIATASNASLPFHSHLSTSNEDNNFTIHFTSSCKESDPSTPVDVSQNQESLSTWATLQNEDNVFSNLSSSVWKQSSECVFPASRWDKSAHYAQAESQDSQKKRSKKYLLSKKTPTLKSQPGSKKGSVHPVNISKDSFSQRYVENSGKCFWTPKSSVPSVEFLPQKGGSRRTGPSNICPEEEPDRLLERKHSKQIKQLCKAFSNTKEATAETEQISRPGSWRSPRGHHNNNSDSSEEEEYKIHFTCSKAAGMQGRPMSPGEAAENEMITRQTVPSLPNSSPQGNLMSGSTLKDDSERLFVALVDYDPLTMSPNSEAAGEELSFKEGQILKVFGDEDAKGFYRGECEEKQGYIPCHMVSEIYIESKEVKEHLLKNSYITEENL
ncbi:peripheral-type benzodiazepine receptor-associated protein 1-like [Anolis carolinensis]|uniref:peripheral-type benzodiazepine receptor-associated protein 1-like n=1 Tax=Anolis carolinensis TaxID=28377 RepID=UPI002F2B31BC